MESHNGHPHLPLYLDFFETSSKWYIVSRICSGGDLLSYIQRTGRPTLLENDARLVVKILLETLAYLHHHEVVHRDLKPVNILLRDPNNLASLCLVDFGSSFVTHVKESPDLWGGMPTTPIEFPTSPGSSTDLSSGEAIVDLVVGDGPDMKTLTGTPFVGFWA